MEVLVLIKPSDTDQFVLDFAEQLKETFKVKLHFLNIVGVNGEVPVHMNGEVLDNCTEFDLSSYYEQQENNIMTLRKLLPAEDKHLVQSKIGRTRKIIDFYVEDKGIELVLSGSRIISQSQDRFSSSFAENLLHLDIPVLALKCEQKLSDWSKAALVHDFDEIQEENLDTLKNMLEKLNLTLEFICLRDSGDRRDEEEIEKSMKTFASLNGLNPVDSRILERSDKIEALQELVLADDLNLLTLGKLSQKRRFGFSSIDIRSEFLNKTRAPILVY